MQLAALGTGVVLARTLGPLEFGRLALVLAVAASAALVANLGGTEATTRFVAELKAKGRLSSLVRVAWPLFVIRIAVSLVAGLAVIALRGPIGDLIGLDGHLSLPLALMAAAYAAISGFQGPSQVFLVNLDRQRFINLVTGVTNLGAFVALIALAAGDLLSVKLAMLVALLSLLVRVVLLVTSALHTVSSGKFAANSVVGQSYTNAVRQRMFRYSGIMFLIGVGGFLLQSRSDEYLVGAMLGVQAVAFYHLAEGFSRTAFSLTSSRLSGFLMTGMLTEGYVQSGASSLRRRFRHIVRLRFALSVPIGIGGALLAGEIVDAVYGPEYSDAAAILALFFLLQMPLQWIGAISGVLVAVEKPQWFLWTKAVSLVTIPLTIWWLRIWGIEGAIAATTLGVAIAAGIEFIMARRYTGISFPIADVARYLLAGGLMAAPVAAIAEFMPGAPWQVLAVAIPVGGVTYMAATIAVRAFSVAELSALKQSLQPARSEVSEPGR